MKTPPLAGIARGGVPGPVVIGISMAGAAEATLPAVPVFRIETVSAKSTHFVMAITAAEVVYLAVLLPNAGVTGILWRRFDADCQ
jgi:hypothetical protein